MENLFSEFKPVDYDSWINQLKKDLKDKPLEVLHTSPEQDVQIKAYHHPVKDHFSGGLSSQLTRITNQFSNRRIYSAGSNQQILIDLMEGIDAISVPVNSLEQYKKDTAGILFEHITADLRISNASLATEKNYPKNAVLNFDVLGLNAEAGQLNFSLENFGAYYELYQHQKACWISGSIYGNSGASTIQELAFTLAHTNEYIQYLVSNNYSLETIAKSMVIELSVNENYFVNLAKMRAVRELMSLLYSAYDSSGTMPDPLLYAQTSCRFLAENDHNNNFLRQTTEAMSAILGGCNVITVQPLKGKSESEEELTLRMAKNIPLILREESHLDKVIDPAAGSMFIENLTDQLIEKSWSKFQEIEHDGGYLACLKSGKIQSEIQANRDYLKGQVNNKKKTFLGVNKFPNSLEKWIDPIPDSPAKGLEFEPIKAFRLETAYEPKPVVS